jgi:hypothetical protein
MTPAAAWARVVSVTLAALAGAGLGAGCSDPSPTARKELSGYVRDERTTEPVRGARVTFRSDTLYTASATTDRDGLYEMVVETDVDFGQVRVEAAGYFPIEQTVYFDTERRRVDFRLRAQ